MYDDLSVYTNTADANAALAFYCRVHKVVLVHADGTGQLTIELHNAATVTGAKVIELKTDGVLAAGALFTSYAEANFDPPVPFSVSVSANLTGTGTYKIYYTRV